MRDFVADHLYRKTESYFTQSAPVHFLQTPLDFRSMWGQSDYQVRSVSCVPFSVLPSLFLV